MMVVGQNTISEFIRMDETNYTSSYQKKYNLKPNMKPIGVMVAKPGFYIPDIGYTCAFIGISMCHNTDFYKWSKEYAYKLAFNRASNPNKTYKIKRIRSHSYDTVDVYDKLLGFLDRCQKYYKNLFVVYPKIEWI